MAAEPPLATPPHLRTSQSARQAPPLRHRCSGWSLPTNSRHVKSLRRVPEVPRLRAPCMQDGHSDGAFRGRPAPTSCTESQGGLSEAAGSRTQGKFRKTQVRGLDTPGTGRPPRGRGARQAPGSAGLGSAACRLLTHRTHISLPGPALPQRPRRCGLEVPTLFGSQRRTHSGIRLPNVSLFAPM